MRYGMWDLIIYVFLLAVWVYVLHKLFNFIIPKWDKLQEARRLPEGQLNKAADDLFQFISSKTAERGDIIDIRPHWAKVRWTTRQRREIIRHLVDQGWIRKYETSIDSYVLTTSGWDERWVRRMKELGPKHSVYQDLRGATAVNAGTWSVGSSGSVKSGDVNITVNQDQAFVSLAEALQEDALVASNPKEREHAERYADQLSTAVATKDHDRARRLVEQVKGFLELATAAFTLTHDVIRQFFS